MPSFDESLLEPVGFNEDLLEPVDETPRGTVSFSDSAFPLTRQFKDRALRAELGTVQGEDKAAKFIAEDKPLLPPLLLPPEDPGSIENIAGRSNLGRVTSSGVRAIEGGVRSASSPSTLPLLPLAAYPPAGTAMGLYFGGQALGAGTGEASVGVQRGEPETIGSGVGQMALGGLMTAKPVVEAGLPVLRAVRDVMRPTTERFTFDEAKLEPVEEAVKPEAVTPKEEAVSKKELEPNPPVGKPVMPIEHRAEPPPDLKEVLDSHGVSFNGETDMNDPENGFTGLPVLQRGELVDYGAGITWTKGDSPAKVAEIINEKRKSFNESKQKPAEQPQAEPAAAPSETLSGKKLHSTFRDLFGSTDDQAKSDIFGEMGYDVDEDTGRFYMTDRDNKRLYLTGEQLADAKREFIQRAQQLKQAQAGKETSARQNETPGQLYADVPASTGKVAPEVPVEKGGEGVQPSQKTGREVPLAADKAKSEIERIAATQGQRPAKEVKSELVDRLEKAVESAPEKESGEPITISIPGDGTFKITNTKEALETVLKQAKRISTSSTELPTIRRRGISKEDNAEVARILANPETAATVQPEPSLPERLVAAIESEADKARLRLAKGGTTFGSGPLHELPNIRDHAIVLASKIARGTFEAAKWSAEMIAKYGEAIRPHLNAIIADAHNVIKEWSDPKKAALADPETPVQKIQSVFTPGLEAGKNIKEGVQSLLLPSAKGPEQLQTAEILGAKLGAMNRSAEASASQLNTASKTFDRLGVHNEDLAPGDNPGIKFMSDVSQGRMLTGKFNTIGDAVEKQFGERVQKLEDAGAPLETVRENYFPGMWTRESRLAFNAALDQAINQGIIPKEGFDINSATPEQKAWVKGATENLLREGKGSEKDMLSYFTRRPMKGRESFRKGKVFDDIMTGAEFGLKPISNNPIDLVKGKLAEMDKSIMANEFFSHLDDLGKLRIIRPGQEIPDGWVKLDDRYGTIYGPPSPAGEFGRRIMGYRIVPESVGDIVNNYLSSSLYNNRYFGALYKGWMATANALNQTQLGMGSAFHAGFTTGDVQISAGANVLKDIYGVLRGNRSLSDIGNTAAKFLTSSFRTAMTGNKVLNAWRNPDGVIDPKIAQVVKATELAGGGYKMEAGMTTEQTTKMVRDWFSEHRIRAAMRSPVALTELMAKPIMDWLVPRQKAGVFSELASRIIEQNPGVPLEQLTPQFRQAWNRVDARLGQVRYNRLFINNTAKNIVQGLVRAPGWTGGTIAEIGGAFPDTLKFLKEWKDTGKLPENIPDRVAYTASLLITVGTANALLTYLFTGKNPQGLDYFAFRTGHKDEHGNDERFLLPTYMKDLVAYARQPLTTLEHKTHPFLSVIDDVARNRDYYGYEIRNPHGTAAEQAAQTSKYVIKAFEPFWTRGTRKELERGAGPLRTSASYFGVMPAPAYINRTPMQNKISELFHLRSGEATKPYGTQEKDAEKHAARNKSEMDVYMFKRLPTSDQEQLRKKMSPAELQRYPMR